MSKKKLIWLAIIFVLIFSVFLSRNKFIRKILSSFLDTQKTTEIESVEIKQFIPADQSVLNYLIADTNNDNSEEIDRKSVV